MKIIVQRVRNASVHVHKKEQGSIDKGLLLLVGIEKGDTIEQARWLADKVIELRIF